MKLPLPRSPSVVAAAVLAAATSMRSSRASPDPFLSPTRRTMSARQGFEISSMRDRVSEAEWNARLDLAVERGCDGVEPDNIDGYQNNSGFPLSYADQLNYNRWLAAEAHARRLSIGLKNDLEQVPDLLADYDWALNEECFSYHECELLLPFIAAGKAVFGVEYELDPADFCPQANAMHFSFLRKNWELDAWRSDCREP